MPLDALPSERAVVVPWGQLAVVDLYLRNQTNGALLQAAVTDWDWRVYDEQSASPQAEVYDELAKAANAANADSTAIILTAAAITGASRLAMGHTFLHKFDPVALWSAVAGRLYTLEYEFRLASSAGTLQVRVPLLIGGRYL